MARFALIPSLLLGVLVLALPAMPASAGAAVAGKAAAADAVPLPEGQRRLEVLDKALRDRRASMDHLVAAFDDVLAAYRTPVGDAKAADKFRRSADRVVARALTAWRADRKHPGVNKREELALYAAAAMPLLAKDVDAKARARLSRRVVSELAAALRQRKPGELSSAWLEAAFGVLGRLGDEAAFVWLTENVIHTRWLLRDRVLAATKALALFADVPGKLRHQLFKKLLVQWEVIEAAAQQGGPGNQTAKRLWDEMRRSVIPLMQKTSGTPRNAKGEALSTMLEFRRWWKDHKNSRKAPWK